jgi:tyrosyl-tRNA synthetase
VNGIKVTDPSYAVTEADFADGGMIKLSLGKKKHALVRRAG